MVVEKYKASEMIKDILEKEGAIREEKYTYAELAEKSGMTRQALYSLLNPNNEMRVDKFKYFLDILGYDIKLERRVPLSKDEMKRLKNAGLI